MPFGLANAPLVFQRTLDIVLSGNKRRSCLIYLEDFVIFSSSIEEDVENVREVMSALKAVGLSKKLSKRKFFLHTFDNLGHVILPARQAAMENKTKPVALAMYPGTNGSQAISRYVQHIPQILSQCNRSFSTALFRQQRVSKSVHSSFYPTCSALSRYQEAVQHEHGCLQSEHRVCLISGG